MSITINDKPIPLKDLQSHLTHDLAAMLAGYDPSAVTITWKTTKKGQGSGTLAPGQSILLEENMVFTVTPNLPIRIIPVGTLVELESGARLFVAHHDKLDAHTSAYCLSISRASAKKVPYNMVWPGIFLEDTLKVVEDQPIKTVK